jgi:hypothetical protein
MNKGEELLMAYQPMGKLPVSALGYESHNVYQGVPPFMDDARSLIASWQPEAVTNNNLLQSAGIKTNWEYRKYLTNNAQSIMTTNTIESYNDVGYVNRFTETPKSSTPYSYPTYLDETKPFGYESSDLKELYLSREQLNARKMIPTFRP